MFRSPKHHFKAHATLTLMNGDVVKHTVSGHVEAINQIGAASVVGRVAADLIMDLDCETIDAPIDIFTINRIEWEA